MTAKNVYPLSGQLLKVISTVDLEYVKSKTCRSDEGK